MTVSESLIPGQPLRMGEMLAAVFRYLRANPAATLGIGALLSTVTSTISAVVMNGVLLGTSSTSPLGRMLAGESLTVAEATLATKQITDAAPALATAAGISVLVQLAAMGVMTLGMVESLKGQQLAPAQLWRAVAWRRIIGVNLAIVGLMLLAAALPVLLAVVVGGAFGLACMAAAGLAGLIIAILTALAVPATVMDGLPVREALRQSVLVTRGGFFRTAWMLFFAGLIWQALGNLIGSPVGAIFGSFAGGTGSAAGSALTSILASIVAGAISLPASAGTITLIYLERVRASRRSNPGPDALPA